MENLYKITIDLFPKIVYTNIVNKRKGENKNGKMENNI